jgi:aryl-alcohol dehydrogenase-like predicted oxidoreductase
MITGCATSSGTQEYGKQHGSLLYQELGSTGLSVSQAGFGCYRVDVSVEEHRGALNKALREGINVIDTSANYSDGGSEELVGVVLEEMIAAGEIAREEVVVVSKVGYLQGQNYRLSQQRKQEGRPFPDLVLYSEGLEHCIHPAFLEDQLTRSLNRLQMETLDCYLLHNPEYFLGWAKKANVPLEEARAEYDRRIELAFRHLESEVEKGRIRAYGMSSNTFPASAQDPQFTSLEKVWRIAEGISPNHHFQVIQLPMNLYETGGVTELNQSGGQSVITFADCKQLGVLINRPLNAIVGNSLTRLAEVQMGGVVDVEQITHLLHELAEMETHFKKSLLPGIEVSQADKETLQDRLSAGELLSQHWKSFPTAEHWQEMTQFFVTTLQSAIQQLLEKGGDAPELSNWIKSYVEKVNPALQHITLFYQHKTADRVMQIKDNATSADAVWGAANTLSQMAIRALRSTKGISSVLVGMRTDAYVEDVLQELTQQVEISERKESWNALHRV